MLGSTRGRTGSKKKGINSSVREGRTKNQRGSIFCLGNCPHGSPGTTEQLPEAFQAIKTELRELGTVSCTEREAGAAR